MSFDQFAALAIGALTLWLVIEGFFAGDRRQWFDADVDWTALSQEERERRYAEYWRLMDDGPER